jgi:hypothetical protein
MRNPFDAIWSEYRRTATEAHIFLSDDFDLEAFATVAISKMSSKYGPVWLNSESHQ